MRKNPRLLFAATLVGLVTALAACNSTEGASTAASKGDFTFLVVADFSGPQSFIGKAMSPMAALACGEINKAGGAMGRSCRYATVDDKSDPADGAIALREALAGNSNVVAVSGLTTATAGAEVPVAIGAHLVVEAASGSTAYVHPTRLFGATKAKFFYTTGQPDILLGYALALGAKAVGLAHPAVVATDGPDTASTLQGISAAMRGISMTPSIVLRLAAGQSSYGTEVQRLIASHPDGIILQITDAQSLGTFMSNYIAAAGALKTPIVDDNTILQPDFYGAVKGVLPAQALHTYMHEVTNTVADPSQTQANPTLQALINLFTTKKLAPASTVPDFAPTYDGWILIALAMDEARSTDPAVVAPYIAKVAGVGATAGQTPVATYAAGVKALAAGKNVLYTGASGTMAWNSEHVRLPAYTVYGWQSRTSGPQIIPGPAISSRQLEALLK